MTGREYLRQAYRLDQKIRSDVEEVSRLRELARGVSAIAPGEKVRTSHATDAPFVRSIEKIIGLEAKIDAEIDIFVALKAQIRETIAALPDADEQMVLRCRYLNGMTWGAIGSELRADERTLRRWHGSALAHIVLPEDPIRL